AGHASETLLGTSAADVYVCGGGSNADLIDNRGHASDGDKVLYTSGITQDQLWFRQVGSDLEVSIIGTSDTVTIQAWYNSASNHVSRFELADGSFLVDSHVQNLVSAMAAMSPPSSGQTCLTSDQYQQLSPIIAANWQH
ncbi:calcium-binding protein, partial [Magnetospirillum aberrantis]